MISKGCAHIPLLDKLSVGLPHSCWTEVFWKASVVFNEVDQCKNMLTVEGHSCQTVAIDTRHLYLSIDLKKDLITLYSIDREIKYYNKFLLQEVICN